MSDQQQPQRLRDRVANMSTRHLLGLLTLVVLAAAVAVGNLKPRQGADCLSIPGDASWPSPDVWQQLNRTVDGKLLATIPIAAVCHRTLFGQSNRLFDQAACDVLRDNWNFPETHLPSSSSPMAYPFSNNSCNPYLDPDTPCTLGSHVVYSVNATKVSHLQAAVAFSRAHNVRLVIRNTGHDYLGKSTGAHALGVWTHHLKSIHLIEHYKNSRYTGPAVRVAAGVEGIEAYTFAHAHGLVIVGGNCPNVGLAGGYIQGGGHGPLSSKYGLASDQILEAEVITAAGDIVTATPDNKYSDLLWALRGGGGGTFGLLTSVTIKAYPDLPVSSASLAVMNDGTNADAIYASIGPFLQKTLPALVDAGAFVVWVAGPFGFLISPAYAPDLTSAQLDGLLRPTLDTLKHAGLQYQYASAQSPTFLDRYNELQKTSSWNVSDYNVAGRLVSRKVATEDTANLVEAIRYISSRTIMSGVSYNLQQGGKSAGSDFNDAVNPYWRKALFGVSVGTPINYQDWPATLAAQDEITNDLLPQLEKVTPHGAAYLNEADFQAKNFEKLFYGDNYPRLLAIKRKYDPKGLFYAKTAVGSEQWKEKSDGRLCRC
ncbi:FAD binding domain-containing protein [Apiospora marii]|uniref:FAD binding domain-containing protein n=1 Tax=Apiospora marii TaxID=335849 RepID=A0ABR1RVS7_9PEZI